SWGSFKSKFAPLTALAMAERVYTIVNSKAGTAQIGGTVNYNKKGKLNLANPSADDVKNWVEKAGE
ncbi:MAG: hypothetical protein IJ150_06200, partial [Bacteroidales bacterium]|nr:hypothetical protein [Bacteroidales bacterium]